MDLSDPKPVWRNNLAVPTITSRIFRNLRVSAIILTSIILFSFATYYRHPQTLLSKIRHDITLDVRNSTLGFQKVFAIGFPMRTDKRDAITLASSYTGFQVDWQKGVSFDEIPDKAAPAEWNFTRESPGALGCWRAHMNVIEKIVSERIQSALILEDDTDWDVTLKTQLQEFSTGMRKLQNSKPVTTSPYGDNWDFAWLGHCRVGSTDDDQDYFVFQNDPTVPPIGLRHSHWRQSHVPEAMQQNGTRVVLKANAGMCMYAYAVTFEGARKILATISLGGQSLAVDTSYSAICRNKYTTEPFNCYGVYPPIMSSHRFAGSADRDSDLNDKPDIWHPEFTWDIVYSAIQNIPRLINGAATVLAQWPGDVSMPEISREGRPLLEGALKRYELMKMGATEIKGVNA